MMLASRKLNIPSHSLSQDDVGLSLKKVWCTISGDQPEGTLLGVCQSNSVAGVLPERL